MRRLFVVASIASILLLGVDAVACQTDTDCSAASRCIRTFGQLEGVCERGISPVQGVERRPLGAPGTPKGEEGHPCELEEDCGSGLHCVAKTDSTTRICGR
ncbi:MAG TPA: hypothetical protein VII72_01995 [Myxococcota bacterium]|jgi:hypothetical protein